MKLLFRKLRSSHCYFSGDINFVVLGVLGGRGAGCGPPF